MAVDCISGSFFIAIYFLQSKHGTTKGWQCLDDVKENYHENEEKEMMLLFLGHVIEGSLTLFQHKLTLPLERETCTLLLLLCTPFDPEPRILEIFSEYFSRKWAARDSLYTPAREYERKSMRIQEKERVRCKCFCLLHFILRAAES